jgi:uncharacterized protein (TIGR02001 family)
MERLQALLGLTAALAVLGARPAMAADISGEAGVTSDYRYRGISLSDGKPAAQASVTLELANGLYGELWSSTLRGPDVEAGFELDFTAGYSLSLSEKLSLDLSGTFYVYPGERASNYGELALAAEHANGPLTARAGFSLAPPQRGTEDEEGRARANSYGFVGASYELIGVPLTLSADLGYERGAFDERRGGGKWDWCLGASLGLAPARLDLNYSGSNGGKDRLILSLFAEF